MKILGVEHVAVVVEELIDEEPRPGGKGCLTAFFHPCSTTGVLVELCQRP